MLTWGMLLGNCRSMHCGMEAYTSPRTRVSGKLPSLYLIGLPGDIVSNLKQFLILCVERMGKEDNCTWDHKSEPHQDTASIGVVIVACPGLTPPPPSGLLSLQVVRTSVLAPRQSPSLLTNRLLIVNLLII